MNFIVNSGYVTPGMGPVDDGTNTKLEYTIGSAALS